MTTLRAGSASHVGQVRAKNDDSTLMVAQRSLFGVADGMGGHQGGEVASAMAVALAEEHAADRSLDSLKQAARIANRAIFEKAGSDPDLHGMGTTLVALQLVDGPEGDEIAWINIGDSRIYVMRDGELRQLSADHSLVEELVRDGKLTSDEAAVHPKRNILTRALGIDVDVVVDGNTVLPLEGDRYLLCSDGLFNEVSIDQMAAVLRRLDDPDEAADELVRLANEGGGRDNISVVVVDVIDDDGRSASILAAQQRAEAAAAAAAAAAEEERARAAAATGQSNGADDTAPVGQVFAGRRSSLPDAHDDYGAESDDLYADLDRVKARRWTWRVLVFLLAIIGVLAAIAAAIGWSARNTYFVAFDGDQVVVYKGKPGGVFWFDPTFDGVTGIERDELRQGLREAIEDKKEFGSRPDVDRYLLNLREQIADSTTTTTTTTSTTTTTEATAGSSVPGVTTSTAARPPASPTTAPPP